MSQSPSTPGRRRRSSGLGSPLTPTMSQSNSSQRRTHSRKSSVQSIVSTNTPRPLSEHEARFDFGPQLGNGLGSLADELAEELWDDDEEVDEISTGEPDDSVIGANDEPTSRGNRDTVNFDNRLSSTDALIGVSDLHGTKGGRSKRRPRPSDYDGSDYGASDEFDEVEGIPPSLDYILAEIEGLARQCIGDNNSPSHKTVARVADQLKNLGPQVNVETHVTRLSNAFTALTAHVNHQSRTVQSLAQPITSPIFSFPDPSTAEELIALLQALLASLPNPAPSPLASIHSLHASTDDLLSTMSMLADSLQVCRSTSNTATRQLRTAREMTATLRRELDEAEEGIAWLEKGDWDARLRRKDAAAACREVVDGFETVCDDWKKRLTKCDTNGVELMAG